MQINFKKDILPHLIGISLFYFVVLFYFSPIVFDGKIIFQYDILQWEGAAKEILDHRAETGEEALWASRIFSGMPAYLVSFEIPGDITNSLTKILTLGLPHPINSLFFGMVSMYILLISFKVRAEFAIPGAIAFAFNTFHLISLDAGHNAKIWAICLIPLILAGIHISMQRKYLLGLALFAFGMMLQLKFNHLQITYYTLWIVLIYGIGELIYAIKQKGLPVFGKAVGILVLGLMLAIGANLSRFMTVLEYSPYSTRGPSNLTSSASASSGLDKDYAFNWSQGKLETLTLLVPYLYGGGSTEQLTSDSATERALRANGVDPAQTREFVQNARTYWGDQPGTGGPIYGGAIMLFLFVLGLLYAPKKEKAVFLGITVFSIFLAWGKNLEWFNYLLFDYLPGYNKFRAVTMAFSMTLFAIPVLGCIGLEQLFKSTDSSKINKNLLIALGSTAGLAAFFWLFAGLFSFRAAVDGNFPNWLAEALMEDRKSLMRSSALKTILFVVLAAGLVFAALKNKLSTQLTGLALGILLVVDLWGINRRYLGEDAMQYSPAEQFFAKTPADERILRDQDYFRVLNIDNPFNDARTSFYHHSVGGYHGAKMKRYQELIENVLSPEIQDFVQKAQEGDFDWQGLGAFNMLNTRYLLAGRGENAVFQNPEANGYGWFPQQVQPVLTNDDEIIQVANMDTKTVATVNEKEYGIPATGTGNVRLKQRGPNELVYEVQAEKAGLVVFSEIYYPKGWIATINGNESPILRTNYLLRGIEVPQGTHEVAFQFQPNAYYSTKTLVVILQYLIALLLLGSVGFNLYTNNKGT
ncbi:MAG: YfhO family protein [Cecembia sp.]